MHICICVERVAIWWCYHVINVTEDMWCWVKHQRTGFCRATECRLGCVRCLTCPWCHNSSHLPARLQWTAHTSPLPSPSGAPVPQIYGQISNKMERKCWKLTKITKTGVEIYIRKKTSWKRQLATRHRIAGDCPVSPPEHRDIPLQSCRVRRCCCCCCAALSGVNDTNAISSLSSSSSSSGRAVSGSDSTGHLQVTAPLGSPGTPQL